MSGVVVWFTGLPASGKTTLARRVRERLAEAGVDSLLLDSDEVRGELAPGRGYGPADRDHFYRELARVAAGHADGGEVVLVAATAPRRAHRDAARAAAPRFVEVLVDVAAAECAARDPKGLYADARAGRAPDLPGVGGVYERPPSADVVARGGHDDDAVIAIVRAVVPSLGS